MLAHLEQLYQRACLVDSRRVTVDLIKEMKREIIKTEGGQLLEEKE